MEERELPRRKHVRLKEYDYSTVGAYFVTICAKNRRSLFSRSVGRGLAPAENNGILMWDGEEELCEVVYTRCGEIAERELLALEQRYPHVVVDRYVIMPNHIHAIVMLRDAECAQTGGLCEQGSAGASPRPTLMDVICSYKSLTVRACKAEGGTGELFQTSFHEHVIRCEKDYDEIVRYITENPMRWRADELYVAE